MVALTVRVNTKLYHAISIDVFQDISVACGICFAYRLDAQIPDQVCEDSRCAQPFHQTCLYEVCNSSPVHVKVKKLQVIGTF